MNKIASMRAAGELIKTASTVILQQQRELEALRLEMSQRDQAEKAAELSELLNNWRVKIGAKIPNELNLNYDKNYKNSKKRKRTKN